MRRLITAAVSCLLAVSASAIDLEQINYDAAYGDETKRKLRTNVGLVETQFNETATFNNVSVTGTLTSSGSSAGSFESVTVTNTEIITLSSDVTYVTCSGAAACTNTVAAPTSNGLQRNIVILGTASVSFADSGTLDMGGNVTRNANDTLEFVSSMSTTQWLSQGSNQN